MADLILVDLRWEMPSVLLPESEVGEVEELEGGMHNLLVSGDILQVCSSAGFEKAREWQRETQFSPLLQWRAAKKSPEQAQGVEIWIGSGNVESKPTLSQWNGWTCRIIPSVLLQKGTQSQLIVKRAVVKVYWYVTVFTSLTTSVGL